MSYFYNHIKIEDDQLKGFLIGSRLGDGAFIKKSNHHNTYIVFKHAADQYDYLLWKYNYLKNFGFLKPDKQIKECKLINCFDNAQKQYYFSTRSFVELNYYKQDTSLLFNDINNMSIAVWLIDDGSLNKKAWKISFPNRSESEKELISLHLDKIGLDYYIYEHKTNRSKDAIVFNNFNQTKELILSNLPEIGTVKRKLHLEG